MDPKIVAYLDKALSEIYAVGDIQAVAARGHLPGIRNSLHPGRLQRKAGIAFFRRAMGQPAVFSGRSS
jgi:hypothetical protein